MKNKILITLISLFLFCSCKTTWYQVSSLQSEDVDENFKFNNDDLTLQYDFWSEGGMLHFSITNNSENPIYIDWENSNFIFNGFSYDYFTDKETINSLGVYKGKSIAGLVDLDYKPNTITPVIVKNSVTTLSTTSTVTKEKKNVQIPPYAYVNSKSIALDFPWIKTKNYTILLNKKNTPLKIRTYIAYSKEKELNSLEYIDNEFWINSIDVLNRKNFSEYQSEKTFYTKGQKFDPIMTGIGAGFTILFFTILFATL